MAKINIQVEVDTETRDVLVRLAEDVRQGGRPNFAAYCGEMLAKAVGLQARRKPS